MKNNTRHSVSKNNPAMTPSRWCALTTLLGMTIQSAFVPALLIATVVVGVQATPAHAQYPRPNPIPIVIPSNGQYDILTSVRAKQAFTFTATAGTSYFINPERVDPITGVPNFSASFQVSIYTQDPNSVPVFDGLNWIDNSVLVYEAYNWLSNMITPPLQNGTYLIVVRDTNFGYQESRPFTLRTEIVSTGSIPFGPVPGATPVTVTSISPATLTVPAGTSRQQTITLSAPAPAGGLPVSIHDNSSFITISGFNGVVPAGATTATYTVTTTRPKNNTSGTVTVSAGGTFTTSKITITR